MTTFKYFIFLAALYSSFSWGLEVTKNSEYHKNYSPKECQDKFDTTIEGKSPSSLLYVKAGAESFTETHVTAAAVGLGYRHLQDYLGYNVSLNASSNLWADQTLLALSLKMHPLICLTPSSNHLIYVGQGIGIGSVDGFFDSHTRFGSYLSAETIFGIEFNKKATSKKFLQLEISKPVKLLSEKATNKLGLSETILDRPYYYQPKNFNKDSSISISTGISF